MAEDTMMSEDDLYSEEEDESSSSPPETEEKKESDTDDVEPTGDLISKKALRITGDVKPGTKYLIECKKDYGDQVSIVKCEKHESKPEMTEDEELAALAE